MAFSSRPSSKIYDKNPIFYHITAYCELIWQIEKSASSPPKYLRFSGCNDLWIFHIAKLTSKSAFSRKFQLLGQTLWVGIKLVFLSARRLFYFSDNRTRNPGCKHLFQLLLGLFQHKSQFPTQCLFYHFLITLVHGCNSLTRFQSILFALIQCFQK